MVRFTILASGSSGNCSYLETPGARILIDAGISGRQIEERMTSIGAVLRNVEAVLITHEHSDHVCGLPQLGKRYGIPIYVNRPTMECLRGQMPAYGGWKVFQTGETLSIGDLTVETFPVPHDAYEPVGFMLHHGAGSIGFLTDLGHPTQLVMERVRRARALVLEANHDVQMLQNDARRPWPVKQRILSRHGHLSNEAAASLIEQVATERLEDLYLGHLSSDCNTPELAREVVGARLRACGAGHVRVHDTAPDRVSTTLVWETAGVVV